MKCFFNKIVSFIIKILIAFYLTMLINQGTLSTNSQFLFVLLYFILVLILCNKFITNLKINKRNFVFTVLLTILTISFFGVYIPKDYSNNKIEINILNEKNKLSEGYECWLTEIEIDNKIYEFYNLNIDTTWELKDNVLFTNGSDNKFFLFLPKAKNVNLKVSKHAWSGKIEVVVNGDRKIYDLYDENGNTLIIKIDNLSKNYNQFIQLLLFVGYVLLIYEFITISLMMIEKINDSYVSVLKSLIITLVVGFLVYMMLPKPNVETITLTAGTSKNFNSNSYEVWLTDVIIDENKLPLSRIDLSNFNWIFTNDSIAYVGGAAGKGSELDLNIPYNNSLELAFSSHSWSGNLNIKDSKNEIIHDLYSSE